MIISFNHKGLRLFFETGDSRKLRQDLVDRIGDILIFLDELVTVDDLALPNFGLHKLTGDLKGYYSTKVNSNWRIIFQFNGKDVYNVNLIDYH